MKLELSQRVDTDSNPRPPPYSLLPLSTLRREDTPKVRHTRRAAQGDEHRRQDRGGMENPVQPVTDRDRDDKGRYQLYPHPRAYSPR